MKLSLFRFGCGSYLCTDGNLQFGVDGVPEDWKNVCLEAQNRRSQITTLNVLRDQLASRFGFAEIIVRNERPLTETIQFLQVILFESVLFIGLNKGKFLYFFLQLLI